MKYSIKIIARKFFFTLVILSMASLAANAAPGDSTKVDTVKFNELKVRVDAIKLTIDTANINIKAIMDTLKKTATAKNICIPCLEGTVTGGDWVLVFLPAFLFLLLLWVLINKGLKGFNLKEAMSENTYPTIIENNPEYTAANLSNAALAAKENLQEIIPPTIEKTYLIGTTTGIPPNVVTTYSPPPPNPSISRYIAFITSILTLVVALGVSSFYIYHYVRTGCPPELSGISTLLIALGIGVMPYAFNKVSAAISKNKES